MSTTPFFSIILPVYGVQAYLPTALDGLLQQTFTDYEIVLVNDASPDDSADICEAYAAQHECITVLTHTENRGLSAARNTGLAAAKGEYVWFMDPDDAVEATLLGQVYDSLQRHPADAVMFGCVEEYYTRRGAIRRIPVTVPAAHYDGDEIIPALPALEASTLLGYAWNKCYRRALVEQHALQYETVPLIEDILFNAAFLEVARSFNVLDTAPYHYAKRNGGSLTARFVPEYYAVHRRRIERLYDQQCRVNNDTEDVRRLFGERYARYIFSALSRHCDPRAKMTRADRAAFLESVFSDELFQRLLPAAAPRGVLPAILAWLLKTKCRGGCLFSARVIYVVQTTLRPLFLRLKG